MYFPATLCVDKCYKGMFFGGQKKAYDNHTLSFKGEFLFSFKGFIPKKFYF